MRTWSDPKHPYLPIAVREFWEWNEAANDANSPHGRRLWLVYGRDPDSQGSRIEAVVEKNFVYGRVFSPECCRRRRMYFSIGYVLLLRAARTSLASQLSRTSTDRDASHDASSLFVALCQDGCSLQHRQRDKLLLCIEHNGNSTAMRCARVFTCRQPGQSCANTRNIQLHLDSRDKQWQGVSVSGPGVQS